MAGTEVDPWANLGEPRKLEPETNQADEDETQQDVFDAKRIQMEGWVEKQSRYLKTWRHRWLVLQHPYLFTFKTRRIYESPTETVNLNGGHVVSNPYWTDPHGPHGFDVVTQDVTFSFRTPTRQNAIEWASNIRLAMRGQPVIRVADSPAHLPGSDQSPNDIEDTMVQHVLRQSALEAGVPYNGHDTKTQQMAAETALRIQQDDEYRLSLEEDMRRAREEEAAQNASTDDSKGEVKASVPSTTDTKSQVNGRGKEEAKEEAFSIPPEPSSGPNSCTCQIRLPSGKRLVRRFNVTDTIKIIRHYVRKSEGLNDSFDLVSNFPRRVWSDLEVTLKATGLGSKCSFFVQPR